MGTPGTQRVWIKEPESSKMNQDSKDPRKRPPSSPGNPHWKRPKVQTMTGDEPQAVLNSETATSSITRAVPRHESVSSVYGRREPGKERESEKALSPSKRQSDAFREPVDGKIDNDASNTALSASTSLSGKNNRTSRASSSKKAAEASIPVQALESGDSVMSADHMHHGKDGSRVDAQMKCLLYQQSSKIAELIACETRCYMTKQTLSKARDSHKAIAELATSGKQLDNAVSFFRASKHEYEEAFKALETVRDEVAHVIRELSVVVGIGATSLGTSSGAQHELGCKIEQLARRMDAQEKENSALKAKVNAHAEHAAAWKTRMDAQDKVISVLKASETDNKKQLSQLRNDFTGVQAFTGFDPDVTKDTLLDRVYALETLPGRHEELLGKVNNVSESIKLYQGALESQAKDRKNVQGLEERVTGLQKLEGTLGHKISELAKAADLESASFWDELSKVSDRLMAVETDALHDKPTDLLMNGMPNSKQKQSKADSDNDSQTTQNGAVQAKAASSKSEHLHRSEHDSMKEVTQKQEGRLAALEHKLEDGYLLDKLLTLMSEAEQTSEPYAVDIQQKRDSLSQHIKSQIGSSLGAEIQEGRVVAKQYVDSEFEKANEVNQNLSRQLLDRMSEVETRLNDLPAEADNVAQSLWDRVKEAVARESRMEANVGKILEALTSRVARLEHGVSRRQDRASSVVGDSARNALVVPDSPNGLVALPTPGSEQEAFVHRMQPNQRHPLVVGGAQMVAGGAPNVAGPQHVNIQQGSNVPRSPLNLPYGPFASVPVSTQQCINFTSELSKHVKSHFTTMNLRINHLDFAIQALQQHYESLNKEDMIRYVATHVLSRLPRAQFLENLQTFQWDTEAAIAEIRPKLQQQSGIIDDLKTNLRQSRHELGQRLDENESAIQRMRTDMNEVEDLETRATLRLKQIEEDVDILNAWQSNTARQLKQVDEDMSGMRTFRRCTEDRLSIAEEPQDWSVSTSAADAGDIAEVQSCVDGLKERVELVEEHLLSKEKQIKGDFLRIRKRLDEISW